MGEIFFEEAGDIDFPSMIFEYRTLERPIPYSFKWEAEFFGNIFGMQPQAGIEAAACCSG